MPDPSQVPALLHAIEQAAPWLAGSISLRKPIERLLGVPIDFLLLPLEDRVDRLRDRLAERRRVEASVLGPDAQSYELASRAATRVVDEAVREQANLDAVFSEALADLHLDPPERVDELSDDFLDRFRRLAADASGASARELFGRVLAGEVRSPGRFSLAALHIFSLMDRRLASLIERWAARTLQGGWLPSGGPFSHWDALQELGALSDLGLLRGNLMMSQNPGEDGFCLITGAGWAYRYRQGQSAIRAFSGIPAFKVTPVGEEVFTVTSKGLTDDEAEALARAIKGERGEIFMGRIKELDGTGGTVEAWQQVF